MTATKRKRFYLSKDQIEITHECKYLGIHLYSHGYFESSSKEATSCKYKSLDDRLKKRNKTIVGVIILDMELVQF